MKKTILEWFEEAKENGAEWVDKAIDNAREMTGDWILTTTSFNLSYALRCVFVWAASPEKHEYWETICEKIEQEEQSENNV